MSANPLRDVQKQAFADFELKRDEIETRLAKNGESFHDVARSLQWPIRMLQDWWRTNKPLQGKK